jgi:hypothetical protein
MLLGLAGLVDINVLLLAPEGGWADAAVNSKSHFFRPPPHHSASPCAGVVPQRLDAQGTGLGTCLWVHGPLSISRPFSPWQLWALLMGIYRASPNGN